MAPKIDDHDIETKIKAAARFLDEGDKLKVTVRFRGREMAHPDRGRALLLAVGEKLKDHGIIERMPLLEGRQMIMVMNPVRAPQVQNVPGAAAGAAPAGPAPASQSPANSPSPQGSRPAAAVPAAQRPAPATPSPVPSRPTAPAAPAPGIRPAAAAPAAPAPTRPPTGNRVH
ncbi:MAG: translation initiation factor [Chloroflexota bacterium]|nr:translation initiation factor [Chloroflexota bacterium]